MNPLPTIVVRADASPAIGTGHVMRCLALAQAWMARGGAVCWAAAELPQPLSARLAREGVFARMITPTGLEHDAAITGALAEEAGAACVVVDGYRFDGRYEARVAEVAPVLAWDDTVHTDHTASRWVLNQNIHARPEMYPTLAPGRVLAGTKFAQLRREFWPLRQWKREVAPVARRLLVTLGGSDPTGTTRRVVGALTGNTGLDVTVVVGAAARFEPALQAAVERAGFRLVTDPPSMPELMAAADLAVSAGGSTAWEMLFMGLPAVTITLADNQRPITAGLAQAGAALSHGWHAELDAVRLADEVRTLAADTARRRAMGALGRTLVDGEGGARVVAALKEQP